MSFTWHVFLRLQCNIQQPHMQFGQWASWTPKFSAHLGFCQTSLSELPCNLPRLLACLFILPFPAFPCPLFTLSPAFPFTVLNCLPAGQSGLFYTVESLHHYSRPNLLVFFLLRLHSGNSFHSYLKAAAGHCHSS